MTSPRKKRMKWSQADMKSALEAVTEEKKTVSSAATMYKVPRKTLDDRVKGRVSHGRKSGPGTVLSATEEDSLCNYLFYMAERGFPLTRRMVMAYAWAIAKRCGKSDRFNSETGPGDRWWTNFRRRHPNVTLRKVDKLDRSRAQNYDPVVVDNYFSLLKKTLEENSLMTSPRRIYNCDESFLPLDGSREKAVTCVKSKCAYGQVCGTTEHITLLCGASAAGIALPPMIIYPKAFPGGAYTFKGPDDTVYAKSESGWVDNELFLLWMKKIFLVYAVPQRPVILIIDGHKSHLTLELIDLARNNDVILLCLPPHTTHALQPLDVSVFKPMKDNYYKSVRAFCFLKRNFIVSKKEFASVIKEPFEKSFSMSNIKAGFKKCGIYPFNPGAVDRMKMKPSEVYSPISSTPNSSFESSFTLVDDNGEDNGDASGEDEDAEEESGEDEEVLLGNQSEEGLPDEVTAVPETPTCITVTPPNTSSSVTPPNTSSSVTPPNTSSSVTPPNTSSSVTPPNTSSSVESSRTENPLVSAGLVPTHLSDIFCTMDVQAKPKRRRLTKARVLTENEFYDLVKGKDREEKEKEEQKQKRKEEREERKKEKEELKKKKEEERKKKKEEKQKKDEEKKKKKELASKKRSRESTDNPEPQPGPSSPGPSSPPATCLRKRQLPAQFQTDTDTSDSNDSDGSGILCALCDAREPEGLKGSRVFWVDCDVCGTWFHTFCTKSSSKKYVCASCN